MYRRNQPTKAEILLGKEIEKLRRKKDLTRMQLGKIINQKEQQVAKYEAGAALVPMSMLELIADSLDAPIQKRVIRRISLLRKIEIDTEVEQEELVEIYSTLFDE
jgi:transcriptional regulator with XRE-family HTH domain